MLTKVYVGNLNCDTTGPQLGLLFARYGAVYGAEVIADPLTGRSRGFAFVRMGSDAEGERAMEALNGEDYAGRALTVAHLPRRPRSPQAGRIGA